MSYTIRENKAHQEGDVILPIGGVGQDGSYRALPTQTLEADQFSANEVNVPAAHADAVVTLPAAGPNRVNVIGGVALSYGSSGTLAGGRLTIADGSETVFDLDIGAKGQQVINFTPPRKGRPNRAMTITLADGGANVQGKLNLLAAWTQYDPSVGEMLFNDENQSGLLPMLF